MGDISHAGAESAGQYDLKQCLHKKVWPCLHFAIFIFYLSDTCIEGEVIPTHYFSARFERNTNVVYCPKISCLIASIV